MTVIELHGQAVAHNKEGAAEVSYLDHRGVRRSMKFTPQDLARVHSYMSAGPHTRDEVVDCWLAAKNKAAEQRENRSARPARAAKSKDELWADEVMRAELAEKQRLVIVRANQERARRGPGYGPEGDKIRRSRLWHHVRSTGRRPS